MATTHVGWKTLFIPDSDRECSVIRYELRGAQNNVRARQVLVLGLPDKQMSCLTTGLAMQKNCEAEALRLFRLLTAQVSILLLGHLYIEILTGTVVITCIKVYTIIITKLLVLKLNNF